MTLDQLTVGMDNQFSTEIKVGGKLMKTGRELILLKFSIENNLTITSFEFGGAVKCHHANNMVEETIDETVDETD